MNIKQHYVHKKGCPFETASFFIENYFIGWCPHQPKRKPQKPQISFYFIGWCPHQPKQISFPYRLLPPPTET
jgi:hypothetical protein